MKGQIETDTEKNMPLMNERKIWGEKKIREKQNEIKKITGWMKGQIGWLKKQTKQTKTKKQKNPRSISKSPLAIYKKTQYQGINWLGI